MDIIIFLGVVTLGWILSSLYPKKFERATEYDSPKDQDYYQIGANLNSYEDAPPIAPAQNSLVLVEVIEETNTYIWGKPSEVLEYIEVVKH